MNWHGALLLVSPGGVGNAEFIWRRKRGRGAWFPSRRAKGPGFLLLHLPPRGCLLDLGTRLLLDEPPSFGGRPVRLWCAAGRGTHRCIALLAPPGWSARRGERADVAAAVCGGNFPRIAVDGSPRRVETAVAGCAGGGGKGFRGGRMVAALLFCRTISAFRGVARCGCRRRHRHRHRHSCSSCYRCCTASPPKGFHLILQRLRFRSVLLKKPRQLPDLIRRPCCICLRACSPCTRISGHAAERVLLLHLPGAGSAAQAVPHDGPGQGE
mmetsp:Transcript_54253/g.172211  ORF Transcript_54253/g.172211 Transcript_54253/m.172211 type:complete len:268 (-) Transcript_54253:369-1172(-)